MRKSIAMKNITHYLPGTVKDKAVLISGGTTGIGRATAIMLAEMGARVLVFGRHQKELDDAMESLEATGAEVYGLTADVSEKLGVEAVFRAVDEKLGSLDILINNAGLAFNGVMEGSFDDWQYIVNTNITGYLACAHEAAKRMQRHGGGHIVQIGSMSAEENTKDSSVYVATKAANRGFSASLRKELNPLGIKVSLIEPGKTASDMQGHDTEQQKQDIRDLKMLEAQDIGAAVLFCLLQPRQSDVVSMQVRPHLQEN